MRSKRILSLLAAAVMLGSCASGESSSQTESSAADTTAAVTTAAVTSAAAASAAQSEAEVTTTSVTETHETEEASEAETSETEKQPSDITPLMWEAETENGGRVVMMGTMHALKEECYPLPESITAALENADALAVECDVTDTASTVAVQMAQLQNMYYPAGESIEDHISAEVLKGVSDFAKACSFDLSLYRRCKPWVYVSLLETIVMMQTDLRIDLGIDSKLLESAKEAGKKIVELETAEEQLELFMSLDDEICEVLMSSYTGDQKERLVGQMEDMYTAWCSGDYDFFAADADGTELLQQLRDEGVDEESAEKFTEIFGRYSEIMLYSRNKVMTEKLEQMLENGENVFFCVGTDHFCGSKGIIELLRADGYQPKQIQP